MCKLLIHLCATKTLLLNQGSRSAQFWVALSTVPRLARTVFSEMYPDVKSLLLFTRVTLAYLSAETSRLRCCYQRNRVTAPALFIV